MKKIIISLLIISLTEIICDGQVTGLYQIKSGNIIPYSANIDDIFTSFNAEIPIANYTFNISEETEIRININCRYETETEFGFNSISIYRNNNLCLELQQEEVWAYTFNGESNLNYKSITLNRHLIFRQAGDKMLLIFIGWPYDSDYPYLTIIAINSTDAKLVYNKQAELVDIEDTINGFEIQYRPNNHKESLKRFTFININQNDNGHELLPILPFDDMGILNP